jgi:methionyl-tRNA formyltransferase
MNKLRLSFFCIYFVTAKGWKLSSITSGNAARHLSLSKKKVVFLGTPLVAAQALQLLSDAANQQNSQFEITTVVTQPPCNTNYNTTYIRSPVQERASLLSLPLLTPSSAKNVDFLEILSQQHVDLCITVAYGNYLPKSFLQIPKYGTINIHPSLLPKYRGAAPIQRCLENGEKEIGVSLLYTVSKMDAGPIISQIPISLNGDEKCSTLLTSLFEVGTKKLIELLPDIFSSSITFEKNTNNQNDLEASAAPKIHSKEGLVFFNQLTATQILNKWRAFDEWPGIYSYFDCFIGESKKHMIIRMKLLSPFVIGSDLSSFYSSSSQTGESHDISILQYHLQPKELVLVINCADGSKLGILQVQAANKKVMSVKSFVNGYRRKIGLKCMTDDQMKQKNIL